MRGLVYEITSAIGGNRYIGATCQPLSNRHAGHRSDYKKHMSGCRNYCSSFEVIKHGDSVATAIEGVDFEHRSQLSARERHYIQSRPCVNRVVPGRTDAEYYNDNRKELLAYQFEYDAKNRDRLSAVQSCECGGRFTVHHKKNHTETSRHKKYLEGIHACPEAS